MKELIELLAKLNGELKAKADKAIKDLGPIDQLEAAQNVTWALNEFKWITAALTENMEHFADIEARIATHDEGVIEAAKAAALESGDIVSKEDLAAQLLAAKQEGKDEVEAKFKLEAEKAELAATRREEVKEVHDEVIAANMSVETLSGDDYLTQANLTASRVTELAKSGITPDHNEVFSRFLAMSKEDYQKEFATIQASLKGLNVKPQKEAEGGIIKPTGIAASKPSHSNLTPAADVEDSSGSTHLII